MEAPELQYDPLDQLRRDGERFLALVAPADLAIAVPACPGWDLADLTWHVGELCWWWSEVVDAGAASNADVAAIGEATRPAPSELVPWAAANVARLNATLAAADRSQPVWSWTGSEQRMPWLHRRLAQELAVHLLDAQLSLGLDPTMAPVVASDGIDEFLMFFARFGQPAAAPLGGTVHLHCTDTTGEWLVHDVGEHLHVERQHAKGDAAVRGTALDLLLWCWRRGDPTVEVLGDVGVAERFQAFSSLG